MEKKNQKGYAYKCGICAQSYTKMIRAFNLFIVIFCSKSPKNQLNRIDKGIYDTSNFTLEFRRLSSETKLFSKCSYRYSIELIFFTQILNNVKCT